MARKLSGSAITANTITTSQLLTTVVTQITSGGGPKITSIIYPGNDTAANTIGGQTVYITGSGFAANASVYINGNTVPAISFISASNVSITTPNLASSTYPVYLINPEDGGTAIKIPGLIVSGEPTWVTSAGSLNASQDEASSWSYTLSATGDATITYALASGSSLPTGISLASNGVISGTLSSPPGSETTYTFSVVASDGQNQDSTRQFTVTVTAGEGVLFANNVLLIHSDGTNNQNNHAFLDSSNNNFTITRYGNATQGSFSPFSQTGWSNYFDGTGDYLTFPSNSQFAFGTGAFTIEFWIYANTISDAFFLSGRASIGTMHITAGGYGGSTIGSLRYVGSSTITTGSTLVTNNQWHHCAIVRDGSSNITLYVDGTSRGTGTDTTNYSGTSGTWYINANDSGPTPGGAAHYSNFRIVKGTAVYTSAFTPSTTALTAIANTSFLTCQSNRFIDNSNNAFSITRYGDVSIQAFAPFAPTAAYTTANVGGSGYFDGTGDYLTVPAGSAFAYGTGDFTVEGWFYATAEPVAYGSILFSQTISGTNYFECVLGSDVASSPSRVVRFQFGTSGSGTGISSSATYNLNSWNHFAIVRNSGSVTVYLNGVGGTSGSCTQNFSDTSYVPTIGRYTHADSNLLTGYLSNFRVVKGTAVYTTNFTPPTGLPTNIANTSLLCNFTNAGIFDQTAKNVLETVGDAKVSTAQYKYGTGSMYFDGSGDYLRIPNSQNLNFASGNFTVEFWVYCTNTSPTQSIFALPANVSGFSGLMFEISSGNTRIISSWTGSWDILNANTGSISVNTWTHMAIVRNGGTLTVYKDGSSTYTNSGLGTSSLVFGTDPETISYGRINQSDARYFYGYLDDFRITKGYARYTAAFSPPTSAFKDK